jgi:flagellar hook-associated protein 3 FlgL
MIEHAYPAFRGRTSNALQRTRVFSQLQATQSGILRLQTQLSTGLRYQRPSEDPSAAARVITLQHGMEFRSQLSNNFRTAQTLLAISESQLAEVQDLTRQARSIGLGSLDTTLSDQQYEQAAIEVETIIDRLLPLINSRYLERFLFSSTPGTQQPPMTAEPLGMVYRGNSATQKFLSDIGQYQSQTVSPQDAFGVLSEGGLLAAPLRPNLSGSMRLSELNAGAGVAKGGIIIGDGERSVSINLSRAHTLQDVVDQLNTVELGDRRLSVTLGSAGLRIDFADDRGGALVIQEMGVGLTVQDLGLTANSFPQPVPIQGGNLNPLIDPATRLDTLFYGTGLNLDGGIRLHQGDQTQVIDLTAAVTIQDLLGALNQNSLHLDFDIHPDGQRLRMRSRVSGTDFSVSEAGGTVAEQLGLRSLTGQTAVSQLNYGRGLGSIAGGDILLTRVDGSQLEIDLSGVFNLQQVLQRINEHPDNQTAGLRIEARLGAEANGLVLTSDAAGAGPITLRAVGSSAAAWSLGLLSTGQTEAVAVSDAGGGWSITGRDPNPQEVQGVFNSLLRLKDAISRRDSAEIERSLQLIEIDGRRLAFNRGRLGIQQQRIDSMIRDNEEQMIQMTIQISDNIDTDMAEMISEMNGRQIAYEAMLRMMGTGFRMNLFDYL